MRSTFAGIAAFAVCVSAHYKFEALIVNGNITSDWEYVRKMTNANWPITDVTAQDFVCNEGGLNADVMAKTSTATVQAGDSVGFIVGPYIGHPGPLSVYMSKAPDGTSAGEYKGDGDWFKVYELTYTNISKDRLVWATGINGFIQNFTFTLPDSLPSGEYLMRAEHIGLHGAYDEGGAQYYVACAQLKVEGSGSGTPGPTVKIPGVYDGTEPGILLNIWYPAATGYATPGPATWPNACEDKTANLVDAASDGDCTAFDGSASSGSSSSNSSSSAAATGSAASTGAASVSTSAPNSTSLNVAGNAASDSTPPAAEEPATGAATSPCKKRRALRGVKEDAQL